jgi:putative hemolysin
MSPVVTQIVAVLLLILLNGLFAMAEIAVISSRKTRLQQRADAGDRGARAALALAETPNRFLSTVQIGITLIGILAGAFGGVTISQELAAALRQIKAIAPYSDVIALTIVVMGITYLSLVIGELVPKRLAMNNPERIAGAMAAPMRLLSILSAPLVHLLSASTEVVLKVLGIRPSDEPPVTEDEIRLLLAQGTKAGIFREVEQDMVESVLKLDDLRASALMTPRPDIYWLDIDDSPDEIRAKIISSPYSRFPVASGSLDEILGEVQAKDLLARSLAGEPFDLQAGLRSPLYVPEIMPALRVLEALRQSSTQMALVIDEYGSVQGLVTINDILEAIVGDIPTADELAYPQVVQREDGSWLVDGMLPIDELKELFHIDSLPGEEQGLYQTVAGFVMMQLGTIPSAADHFTWAWLRFEVVDMDGPRVDKVLITPEVAALQADLESD